MCVYVFARHMIWKAFVILALQFKKCLHVQIYTALCIMHCLEVNIHKFCCFPSGCYDNEV